MHQCCSLQRLAGILSGGLLGLFLLGLISQRARSADAAIAVGAATLIILWMTASLDSFSRLAPGWSWPERIGRLRSPLDGLMIPVVGTLSVVCIGGLLALRRRRDMQDETAHARGQDETRN